MMASTNVAKTIDVLVEDEPSYAELLNLYNELRTEQAETPEVAVSQRALAQVLGELIDYLDFVQEGLEKSIGLTRAAERKRIITSFEAPRSEDPIECVDSIIHQWELIERYTPNKIHATFD